MPRRRPQIQAVSDHVVAPSETTSAKTVKVTDETVIEVIQSEIEIDIPLVVEEVVEVAVEAPVNKSKRISTDLGVMDTKEEPRSSTPDTGAPNGLILSATEPVRIEADDYGNYVVVKRDVYRKVYPLNSKRPSYYLIYTKGSRVLKSTLQALN